MNSAPVRKIIHVDMDAFVGRTPGRVRATVLHAKVHWRCVLDLHLEMRAARLARPVTVLQSDASLSAHAKRSATRDRAAAHRAMPDAYVSAHHLRDLLNETSVQQLFIWSKEPSLLPRVPSGPKRGKGWDRLSEETLRNFLLDRNEDIRFSVESELSRRRKYGTIAITEPAQRSLL